MEKYNEEKIVEKLPLIMTFNDLKEIWKGIPNDRLKKIKKNQKFLTEYEILKQLPPETWLDFIVLKYDDTPPSPTEMFEDCRKWVSEIGKTVKINDSGRLVWFARVEDKSDGENFMPRHLHVLLGKKYISERTIYGSKLGLWTNPYARSIWFSKKWEHGHSYIEPFNEFDGDGVGYVCKVTRRSKREETYFSTGLKNLIVEGDVHDD